MKKRRSKFPIRLVLVGLLVLAGIFILIFFPFRYLTSADYFKIKNSEHFTGENLFKVNLKKEAERLRGMYPEYKSITLRRLLPDRIVIDFRARQAIARVQLSEYFYVDKEGVLFFPTSQRDDDSPLPLFVGLEARILHPRSGVKCYDNSLLATLEFINHLNKDRDLVELIKIKEINLANAEDLILFTDTGCRINLGSYRSLDKDLSILQTLVSEIDSDLSEIEYIELRFKETVVKYK